MVRTTGKMLGERSGIDPRQRSMGCTQRGIDDVSPPKPVLHVTVGRESSPEEVADVESAFADAFDVRIAPDHIRLSMDIPMLVEISITVSTGVASGLLGNLIWAGIGRLRGRWRSKRKIQVVCVKSSDVWIVGERGGLHRHEREEIVFTSDDGLREHMIRALTETTQPDDAE